MSCPRNGEECFEYYCGGNQDGFCSSGGETYKSSRFAIEIINGNLVSIPLNHHDQQVKEQVLDAIVKEFEQIDSCEFASFTLCMIREIAEKMKGGKK